MRAGEEEEEAVLPTASDEGHAEPCDSSLWCCSGDRLSLLLSSSNAYESSCLGSFPWFTARRGDTEVGVSAGLHHPHLYTRNKHAVGTQVHQDPRGSVGLHT